MKPIAGAFLFLAAFTGCRGAPEERVRAAVFDRIMFLHVQYNNALSDQNAFRIRVVASDLQQLLAEHFERVTGGLASQDAERQAYAAFALGFSQNRAAVAPLVEATSHPDAVVRGNAVAALGMLGFADISLDLFLKLLDDADPRVREATLFGLRGVVNDKTRNDALVDKVHEKLSDTVSEVRNEALILLRKIRRPASVAAIVQGPIRDLEPLVRSNAAATLGAIGRDARTANPQLIEMLKDEVHKVVESAWVALNWINEKDLDRSYATWRDWYEDDLKHEYRCEEHKDAARFVCRDHRAAPAKAPGACAECRKPLEREEGPGECPECGKKLERVPRAPQRKTADTPAAPAAATSYACPAHPEIVTATPAKCGKPGCGKDLAPNKPAPVLYACPDHAEVVTAGPSRCGKPGCGKDLVPRK
jgi:hypothetical protein